MRSSSFVSSAALIVVTCLIGAWRFQPTNQPTNTLNFVARFRNGESSSDRGADFANRLGRCAVGKRAMPQGACVREDTARTAWATGCGDYDVYELGFDDDQGYNDVGEQMEIAGCVAGTMSATTAARMKIWGFGRRRRRALSSTAKIMRCIGRPGL